MGEWQLQLLELKLDWAVALPCALYHAVARFLTSTQCPRPVLLFLQAFLDSSKARAPFQPGMVAPPPPGAALSLADQCRVRDRSTIMARQLFAEQGPAFAGAPAGLQCRAGSF